VTPPATAAARRAVAGRAGSGFRVGPAPRPARRVSGPARPARPVAVPRRRATRSADALGSRALGWLRTLPDHRLLDRLIGGRVWIVLLGTLLVGIVTMQLTLLRWNAGIGRAVARSTQLEQRNAALRLSNSQLSDSQRIVALATQAGFVMPPQGSPRFVAASEGDASKALTTMRVPDPAAAIPVATTDPSAIVPVDPAMTDPSAATTDPAATTTAPVATTDPAATTAPVAATTPAPTTAAAPATGTTAPTTASPVAGGASAPAAGTVGPQG
jgi:hypothetical protein